MQTQYIVRQSETERRQLARDGKWDGKWDGKGGPNWPDLGDRRWVRG
jgi:hypothetical protein